MIIKISGSIIFSLFVLFALQATKPGARRISSHVILISISGLRSDLVAGVELSRSRIPTIESLRAKGAYAVGVESVFPSQTNPAHTTIVTGTLPADHGITSDYPFDERTAMQSREPHRWAEEIKTDTIWELARRASLITAAVGYPLTSGAAINFNLTEFAEGHPELRREKKSLIQTEDSLKASQAVLLIEKYRPNLLLINFTSFDTAQRRYGLLSEESLNSLEFVDGLIKTIVEAIDRARIADETTFIIVSDYGAAKIEREFNPNAVLAKKGWLTQNAQGQIVSWRAIAQTFGGSAAIFVKDPEDEIFVREVEDLFQKQYEKPDSPIWRVISRRDAARLGADPRAAFYLDAAPSYAMSNRTTGSIITKAGERTANGYSPSRSEMRASFIIAGRGIRQGVKVEYARLVDIAPTISRLFGLEMKTARGRVITEAINQ
jgi:predicted AlkP superfamily pyrophosphatase or phosphodiesterase